MCDARGYLSHGREKRDTKVRDSKPCEHDRTRMNEAQKCAALFSINRSIVIDLAACTSRGENRERS